MIVVIADDLSGAAELAGAAVRHGLSAEVQTTFDPATDTEVVCVDTATRQLPPLDAAQRVTDVTRHIIAIEPAWLFKKCDSVLRGPVLAEARAVATTAALPRILLVPANPSRGRTISGGIYWIAGQPLHETLFARDPTHPRLTANVRSLLEGELTHVAVPDIATIRDVQCQAELVDASTLAVGGLDFFEALLQARVPQRLPASSLRYAEARTLLVCGSEASWHQRQSEATARGIPVLDLSLGIPTVIGALKKHDSVLFGIGNGPETRSVAPRALTARLAESVATILRAIDVDQVLLEGGSTAAAVIAAHGWTRLRAAYVSDPGLGMLQPVAAHAPVLLVKPGSYPWPAAFWP